MKLRSSQTSLYFPKQILILACICLSFWHQSANGSDEQKSSSTEQKQIQLTKKSYHGNIQVEKALSINEVQPALASASSVEGNKLYDKFSCAQCHQIQHAGGYAGPSLDGVKQFGRKYVSAHITSPQGEAVKKDKFYELVPTSMPSYPITRQQAEKITDYLMTLPN